MAVSKNLIARISYGELQVMLTAESASWNPDVADDLVKRIGSLFKESLESMQEFGVWDSATADEDD